MKKYDLITPEGTRDLLFAESVARREVEEKLRRLFTKYGYSEVITPGVEFYDVFHSKSRRLRQESMYKLTDGRGRLIVIRPDSTLPIARLAATRMREETLPLKLYYNQNIFKVSRRDSGRDDEITQSGIEIIGGEITRSDYEVMTIGVEVLKCLSAADYRFEIGDCGFFRLISARLELCEEAVEEVRYCIETKNLHELKALLQKKPQNEYTRALSELPECFGGAEVFDRAEKLFSDPAAREKLRYLREAYELLCLLGSADKLSVDLGMTSKTDYYTGIMFRGYLEGFGKPALSGGRYDTLLGDFGVPLPATGFAVNVNAAAGALLQKKGDTLRTAPDVLVHAGNGDKQCFARAVEVMQELTAKGMTAEYSLCKTAEEARAYATAKRIKSLVTVCPDRITEESL